MGLIRLSYDGGLKRYVATAWFRGELDCHLGDSALEAEAAALAELEMRHGRPVEIRPTPGEHRVRVVRWSGVPMLLRDDVAVTLTEEAVKSLAERPPNEVASYLRNHLSKQASTKLRKLLKAWITEPTTDWALVPADATKAMLEGFDFDPDEPVEEALNRHLATLGGDPP